MNDMTTSSGAQLPEPVIATQLSVSGIVTEYEQRHAVDSLTAAVSACADQITRCTIRLEHATDPHHRRLAVARVGVDLDGTPVHAHAEGASLAEAADLAANRLQERLHRHIERQISARRHGASSPDGEWRHGDLPSTPTPYLERSRDDRRIEHHVTFAAGTSTVDEAVFDLNALGFDFLLFVESTSGADALIERVDERHDAYVVRFAGGPETAPDWADPAPVVSVDLDQRPAPELTRDEALGVLDNGGLTRVFYRDPATGRAHVLHRRFDGHLGVITPAT